MFELAMLDAFGRPPSSDEARWVSTQSIDNCLMRDAPASPTRSLIIQRSRPDVIRETGYLTYTYHLCLYWLS